MKNLHRAFPGEGSAMVRKENLPFINSSQREARSTNPHAPIVRYRTSPAQFYSCFISYARKDQKFAERLYADLNVRGVNCWFAPHDLQGGKKLHEQIRKAIQAYDRLLLIISEHSMHSEWVKTEIANARRRELKERRQILFPLGLVPFRRIKVWTCFDADTARDAARDIREYFIPDFSNWQNERCYRRVFERLLRDLKAPG